MRNFKLTLQYDGTAFNGWQIQGRGERTVQGELARTLLGILKKKVTVIGSGRTDAGVHALGQVANFKAVTRMNPLEIRRALNSRLPQDIVVTDVREVPPEFHAQYSARCKWYRYTVLNREWADVQERNFSLLFPHRLNLSRMRREAAGLVGRHDFKSFQAKDLARVDRDSVRTVTRLAIKKSGPWVWIDAEANGFLYKMVRNIVGGLLAVGSRQLPPGSLVRILEAKDRSLAPATAHPHGLCLMSVDYGPEMT